MSLVDASALRLDPRITGTPESTKYFELIADPNGPVAKAVENGAAISSIFVTRHSELIPQPPQLLPDQLIELSAHL
ncbi:hypothetical protein AAIH74_36450, partial [Pseudomonas aeruginosa]|uniref:hypothetical protein n=1 Tax=Pseudomonas aeruginosa TaxID=287 RepID=UPI0031B6B0C0